MNLKILAAVAAIGGAAAATQLMPSTGANTLATDPTLSDWQTNPNGSLVRWLKTDAQRSKRLALNSLTQCSNVSSTEGWGREDVRTLAADIALNGILASIGEPNRSQEFVAKFDQMSRDDQRIHLQVVTSFSDPKVASCISTKFIEHISSSVKS